MVQTWLQSVKMAFDNAHPVEISYTRRRPRSAYGIVLIMPGGIARAVPLERRLRRSGR